jgi:hypothetical protein
MQCFSVSSLGTHNSGVPPALCVARVGTGRLLAPAHLIALTVPECICQVDRYCPVHIVEKGIQELMVKDNLSFVHA